MENKENGGETMNIYMFFLIIIIVSCINKYLYIYLPGYLDLAQIKKGVCLLINLEVGKIKKISDPSVPLAFFLDFQASPNMITSCKNHHDDRTCRQI